MSKTFLPLFRAQEQKSTENTYSPFSLSLPPPPSFCQEGSFSTLQNPLGGKRASRANEKRVVAGVGRKMEDREV